MSKGNSFLWQFYPYFVLIVLLSLVALGFFSSRSIRRLYLHRTSQDLQARSLLVAELISSDFESARFETIASLCDSLGGRLRSRITVILPEGTVIADSEEDPAVMDNHAARPEIRTALQGGIGVSTRFSYTLGSEMMYVAFPLVREDAVVGVVRSSLPVVELRQTLNIMYRRIFLIGLIIATLAALVSIFLYYRIKTPLESLKNMALDVGEGNLDQRLHIPNPEEFRVLAEAMNQMATQLNDRLNIITDQRNELEGILTSMVEGVLVVSGKERILRINRAAAEMLGLKSGDAEEKSVQEAIRNVDLFRFIRHILISGKSGEKEVVLKREEETALQVYGTLLKDESGKSAGALIVLHDITRIKRLESIKKDFVANVSHELKTPVAAIKGSVETLQDGAVKNAKDADRFIGIILKHANRLNAIIDDLLDLSRLESETEKREIDFIQTHLGPIIDEAVSACRSRAEQKKIKFDIQCHAGIKATVHPPFIEEALINLIDNAVKYSPSRSTIRVECGMENDETVMRVIDRGSGIAPEHQSRIFERFYRVDKARSRNIGGTGLGLAIVKHIVLLHDGTISVDSTPGEGSAFTIRLPSSKT